MVVILDGVRTPFGKFGGGLKDYSSSELAVITAKEAIRKIGLDPEEIEESIYGNVIQDEWAGISQVRAESATKSGIFSEEIITLLSKGKNSQWVQKDELIRGISCVEQLKTLPTAFLKEGSITAGNSSGINDGAVSLLIASDRWSEEKNLKPLAKILGYATVGCDPKMMGLGPVFAIPKALQLAGVRLGDVDLFEINEAYASQTLAVIRELNLNPDKTNVNGGAIAIGHPLGASGTRVILTLAYELRRRNLKYGVASLCIGGGQGIAIVLENSA